MKNITKKDFEARVISCNKNLNIRSISKIFNISKIEIYTIFRKYNIQISPRIKNNFSDIHISKNRKKSIYNKRFCKPYKTSQLT